MNGLSSSKTFAVKATVCAADAQRVLDERASHVLPFLDVEERPWFNRCVRECVAYLNARCVLDQNELWQVEVSAGGFQAWRR